MTGRGLRYPRAELEAGRPLLAGLVGSGPVRPGSAGRVRAEADALAGKRARVLGRIVTEMLDVTGDPVPADLDARLREWVREHPRRTGTGSTTTPGRSWAPARRAVGGGDAGRVPATCAASGATGRRSRRDFGRVGVTEPRQQRRGASYDAGSSDAGTSGLSGAGPAVSAAPSSATDRC